MRPAQCLDVLSRPTNGIVYVHDSMSYPNEIQLPISGATTSQLSLRTAEESLRTRFVVQYWEGPPTVRGGGEEIATGRFASTSGKIAVTPLVGDTEGELPLPAVGDYRYALFQQGDEEAMRRSTDVWERAEEEDIDESRVWELLSELDGTETYTLQLWKEASHHDFQGNP